MFRLDMPSRTNTAAIGSTFGSTINGQPRNAPFVLGPDLLRYLLPAHNSASLSVPTMRNSAPRARSGYAQSLRNTYLGAARTDYLGMGGAPA